jgi:heptosyltransferase I
LKAIVKMQALEKILIVKLSSIGDVVHSLPFLEVLKENYPHAIIDWLVEREAFEVLNGHPAIDRIIVSGRKAWQKGLFNGAGCLSVLREAVYLLRQIRQSRYDLVVDLQGLLKSGVLVGISRGESKVGMAGGREGAGLFLNKSPIPVNYEQHAVDRYLEVARNIGCSVTSTKGAIPFFESDRKRVKEYLYINGSEKTPLVAINPMARWKTKLWEPERFASLADRLVEKLACKIVFTGGSQDVPVIENISEMMKNKPINLAGKTSLKELACLYKMCDALVTTDTGPMHIAAAMGCRVIALFGPTDPLRTGPYGQGHEVIRTGIECSPCFKKKCDHCTCMKDITVGMCFDIVSRMLNKT